MYLLYQIVLLKFSYYLLSHLLIPNHHHQLQILYSGSVIETHSTSGVDS